jgi:hypothetical protein
VTDPCSEISNGQSDGLTASPQPVTLIVCPLKTLGSLVLSETASCGRSGCSGALRTPSAVIVREDLDWTVIIDGWRTDTGPQVLKVVESDQNPFHPTIPPPAHSVAGIGKGRTRLKPSVELPVAVPLWLNVFIPGVIGQCQIDLSSVGRTHESMLPISAHGSHQVGGETIGSMADGLPNDTISPQWQRQIAILREVAHKVDIHADLIATVDTQWQARIQVNNNAGEIHLLPLGDTLNQGRLLRIRAKARWTFELWDKPVHGVMGTVVKKQVVPFERGTGTLNEFLGVMLEGRASTSAALVTTTWDDKVESFRRYSHADRMKADLLESVNPKWTYVSEVNDNGQRVEIQRLGDTPRDGVKLNVRLNSDRYLFELRHQESTGRDDVLREAETTIVDAPSLLDELLTTMLSEKVERSNSAHVTAQEVFKTMLRQQIAPGLREMGFKGSGNNYQMSREGYRIQIELQRSKWSTRDSVQFDANVSVRHPPTVELFNEANQTARQQGKAMENLGWNFHPRLSQLARPNTTQFSWVVRPNEPSEPVAHDFIESVRDYFLPVIEEEVRRPLTSPTPLNERADQTYKSVVYFLAQMGREPASQVEGALGHGETPDQVADALLVEQGLGPIEAIRALRDGGGMSLDAAKEIVRRNLSPDRQVPPEQLWDEALKDLDEEPDEG